jgi:RNA polymerase sigma-70 factor, ECF subfamily
VATQTPPTPPGSMGSGPPKPPPGPPGADASAFAAIAEENRPYLYRIALRLSGKPEIAKDLVQETLYRGWNHFDQFQEGTHATTWLTAILQHLFYDYLRHEKVVRKAEPLLTIEQEVECDPVVSRVSDAELHAAIHALDPELRKLVELCYLQKKRHREAAAALGIPIGTVGTRLMRARKQLHALLTTSKARTP